MTLRRCASTLCILIGAASLLSQDYGALQNTLISFYRYQRAGTKNYNPDNPFYKSSPYPHANDSYNGHPLDGGWYDAGDFVKFGLPLGFTVYCLLKGYDVFPQGYDDLRTWDYRHTPDGIPDILNEVKVATDYLIKAVIDQNTIVMDVGNAVADHNVWANGYNASGDRTVYRATGADVPGLYAASLALMSKLYKPYDADYASTCLQKAQQAYAFCDNHRFLSNNFQKDPGNGNKPFYNTTVWEDKMACGAIELYRATNNEEYLAQAKELMGSIGQHYAAVGYSHCGDLAGFEMFRLGETALANKWIADINYAVANRVVECTASGCQLVNGACVVVNWGVCGNAANAAFSAALAYMAKGDNKYRDFVYQQIAWIAGLSPFSRSWITRYGQSAPQNPHHRNDANTAGVSLVGGIVSGPTANVDYMDPAKANTYQWTFSDNVSTYENTEVALDYNAGAVGAVAFIRYYETASCQRIDQGLTASPEQVDFNTVNSVAIRASLENAADWVVTLKGRQSGAQRRYKGSGRSISVDWDGHADNGGFTSGELVDIRLSLDGLCGYHEGKAAATVLLLQARDMPFRSDDRCIDDFEDRDLVNKLGGPWQAFSDRSDSVSGAKSSRPSPVIVETGKNGSAGLNFRMTATAGAPHPYAGVRACFTAGCGTAGIGQVKSVVFDVMASSDSARFRVELEQPSITDAGYHGYEVRLGKAGSWQRLRVWIAEFTQPSWAVHQPLTPQNVSALRFVVHAGSANLTIDNVHLGEADIDAPVAQAGVAVPRVSRQALSSGSAVTFALPPAAAPAAVIIITDMRGRVVRRMTLQPPADNRFSMATTALPKGVYRALVADSRGSVLLSVRFSVMR